MLWDEIDQQRLLFDISPTAAEFCHPSAGLIAEQLNQQGFSVWREVATVEEAFNLAMSALAALGKDEPYRSLRFREFRVAKADRIPVCESMKVTGFQCLHFDYGLPVLAWGEQALYGAVALYKPLGSEPSSAETRIFHLSGLKKATRQLRDDDIRRCLREYVEAHGDGWRQPVAANTGRISILLRFLDAIFARRQFATLIESDSAQFLSDAVPSSATQALGVEHERALLLELGVDLEPVEKRVCLQPGDLLLLDKIAVVHGRIGRRQPRELWQMLFGLPSLSVTEVERTVKTVCSVISSENRLAN